MPWLLLQLTPPPDMGPIDRWLIYTLAAVLVFMGGVVLSLAKMVLNQCQDAGKKSDAGGAKWEATSNKATTELYEANKTIGRAVDTLERQGVLMDAQAKDLSAVKVDGVELRRMLAGVEQEVRGLREAARRPSGGD